MNGVEKNNRAIAEFMQHSPKIEYAVGNKKKKSICYSPSQVGDYFTTANSQKAECERWLKEQHERYPEGWVTKEGYETIKYEYYPLYDSDWSLLMPVVERIEAGKYRFEIGKHRIIIYYTNSHDSIIDVDADDYDTKLEATYTAVTSFINNLG